ncbi:MAG: 2-amino-4-hydroxy-6-hydroxymethyldihydropteridine diphosphokinase [Helicobacteraceae bacterium]|jgi:2-amino-4-hydroxy-6-hydroxymethyldihydropteridine diphosphokinase|nr:2-amino-4-hydroxy-6-hydroxymethyldihydropteridine diphosphokinase [Helicobacteraceae bacterium]
MKKTIDTENAFFYTELYPKNNKKSAKKFYALIGIGANIGNLKKTFHKVYFYLYSMREIDIVKTSPIYENPDFAEAKNPKFFNAAILIKTTLNPLNLLKSLLKVETRFYRERPYKNAPRLIDLDIIFYENKVGRNVLYFQDKKAENLAIPHPFWDKRASVILPTLNLRGKL